MTRVRRGSPLGELVWLRQAMDRLFEDSFVRPRTWAFGALDGHTFPVDVTTTHQATNGSNVEKGLAAGETPSQTARANV